MKGLSKGRYDETSAGEDVRQYDKGIKFADCPYSQIICLSRYNYFE